jgi:hypothetical protein
VILAPGFVRVLCQILDKFEELFALAPEESHGGKKLRCPHGGTFRAGRANNGTMVESLRSGTLLAPA